jgi:hypothetical protein
MRDLLALMAYGGGTASSWAFGISMGWYKFPIFSPMQWALMWGACCILFLALRIHEQIK